MTFKQILTVAVVAGLMSTLSLVVYNKYCTTKTAYIEIKKVFNGFQMKKELEEKYKQTQKGRERILDSLSFNLKILSKHLNEQEKQKQVDQAALHQFEYSREEFLKLKGQYQEDNAALSQKYDAQILEQLTQYVIEYGKKNHYDLILGADGNGNLMYSKESFNISDDIIVFINDKYKGVE